MFTDTHCHLAEPALLNQLPAILHAAQQADVSGMIVPATCPDDWQTVLNLSREPMIRAVGIGIHPWFIRHENAGCLAQLDALLQQNPHAWLGEIGLDFHAKSPNATQTALQTQLFEAQLDLSQQYQRPIILHSLKANHAIIRSLHRTRWTQGGIAHAFSGSLHEAMQLIQHGFLIGLGTLLLNPNAKKARAAAQSLPLEHIVLETDSPFGLKNQINSPAHLLAIAQEVAQIRQISLAELADACEQNLQRLFD